tara:strand:- start:6166 stop:6780 length:615 start_codon:yes stop_codon:yes gene_type:complete
MYKKGHVKRILNELERYSTPITYLYKNSMISNSIEFIDDTKNLYVNIYIRNKNNDYIKIYIPEQYPFKPYQIHSFKLLNKEQLNLDIGYKYNKFLINLQKSIKNKDLLLMYMIMYFGNNLNNYFSINEVHIYHTLRKNNWLCYNSVISKEEWTVSKTIFDFILEYRQIDIIMEFNNKNLQEIFDNTRLSLLNDDIIQHILTFVM